jgi:arginase family enzyme
MAIVGNLLARAGIATFSKLPLALDPSGLAGADAAIVGAPMDETVSNRPGSRFGPRAVRMADDSAGVPPQRPHMLLGVDPYSVLNVVDYGDAEVVPGDTERSHAAIKKIIGEVLTAGAIPFVLGGDHSIADHHGHGRRRSPRPRQGGRNPLRRSR